jgi:hypothetical protein
MAIAPPSAFGFSGAPAMPSAPEAEVGEQSEPGPLGVAREKSIYVMRITVRRQPLAYAPSKQIPKSGRNPELVQTGESHAYD